MRQNQEKEVAFHPTSVEKSRAGDLTGELPHQYHGEGDHRGLSQRTSCTGKANPLQPCCCSFPIVTNALKVTSVPRLEAKHEASHSKACWLCWPEEYQQRSLLSSMVTAYPSATPRSPTQRHLLFIHFKTPNFQLHGVSLQMGQEKYIPIIKNYLNCHHTITRNTGDHKWNRRNNSFSKELDRAMCAAFIFFFYFF